MKIVQEPFKNGKFEYVWSRRGYFDGHIVDCRFDGLSESVGSNR